MFKKFGIAAAGAAGIAISLLSATSAQAFTIFTNRADWEAAVGSFTTETFDDEIPNATTITFDNGVVSRGNGGTEVNQVLGGVYEGAVDTSGDFPEVFNSIRWQFPTAVIGFAADWISTASGGGLTVSGNFDGTGTQTISFRDVLGTPGTGFLGIVGDAPFSEVIFREENPSNPEETIFEEFYRADNLSIAEADEVPPTESVPEPAMMAGLAVTGAGMLLQRRSKKAVS